MVRICAWCGDSLDEIEPFDDLRVSHGICGPCKAKWLAAAGIADAAQIAYPEVQLATDDDLEKQAIYEIERLGFKPSEVLA